MIHMSFATFTAREEVRKQCIAKSKNEEFNGRKVFVAEDLSKKVQLKRKAKMDAFKKLQKEGKKPFFTFPDIIRYSTATGVVTVG